MEDWWNENINGLIDGKMPADNYKHAKGLSLHLSYENIFNLF